MNGCDHRYQGLKCIEDILQIRQFKSNSLELREGKPAWFELQVLSHSDFEVEWFHDGYRITNSRARFIITAFDKKNATSLHTLQLDRVLQRDKGEWKIVVSNNVTYVTRNVAVTVIPELVLKMNPQFDFSIQTGDNIYLQCTVTNPESLYYVTNGRLVFMKNGSLFTALFMEVIQMFPIYGGNCQQQVMTQVDIPAHTPVTTTQFLFPSL